MPHEDNDALLTEQQVADELRKSTATLGRWRRNGTGPRWIRVGKTPMYRRSDLSAWIAAQAGEGPENTSSQP
jgi:hypothetical protein